MSRLDDLPPDQRATLSLLLRSRKSYADVAALLSIPERVVRDRAQAALAVLAARQARALTAERREQVGDYLLGQRAGVAERLAVRTYLEDDAAAREWANAISRELAPLASAPLPEIHDGAAPAAERPRAAPGDADQAAGAAPGAPPARRSLPSPPSSRLGGALLLAAIVAGVVVAVVLLSGGGSGKSGPGGAGGAAASAGSATSSTAGSGSTGTQTAKAKEDRRITLRPPNAASHAAGVAEVLSEGTQYAFYIAAEHLPPSQGKGFFYAVWLYNSPSSHEPLSRAPTVGSNGSMQGGALLPKDASKYHTMLVTRETSSHPTHPGPVVLRGSFALH
jgi:hypothetical protein